MQALQILVDGFAISSLYALGAIGFTLIFGVSGVLNLSHGAIMVVAALIGWYAGGTLAFGTYLGALAGVAAALALAYLTYFVVVRPIQRSRSIAHEETEIFVLTGTLLWGIMIQVGMSYLFSDNPVTMLPLVSGTSDIFGVTTPNNEILVAVLCWLVMCLLWLFVNRTGAGKALLAASINPRALTLLGFNLSRIYWLVWGIYGVLAGIAGVLLASFLGVSTNNVSQLTASAFSIVVLGGLGSVSGSLIAAYVVGYLETATAYLIAPTLRPIPALILLVLVVYARPQGLLGRR
ncbi:branched-chain amino acid ABC transporter permease [Bradyrhizobium sp.]|uniref:branched-chain amino acid ABC transporter permease n=1 Tax=Bradyrhizobium sp. TaxID=376 RepID=UPI003C5F32B4